MTGFALSLWLYETTGSALSMALASVCSYAPLRPRPPEGAKNKINSGCPHT